jgi:hypothetical protein
MRGWSIPDYTQIMKVGWLVMHAACKRKKYAGFSHNNNNNNNIQQQLYSLIIPVNYSFQRRQHFKMHHYIVLNENILLKGKVPVTARVH